MFNSVLPSIRRYTGIARHASTLLTCLLTVLLATGLKAAEKQTANPGQKGPLKIVFAGDVMLDGGPGHALSNNEGHLQRRRVALDAGRYLRVQPGMRRSPAADTARIN